jgi:excinuclease ABC subunit C
VSDGKLIQSQTFLMENIADEDDDAVLSAFVKQHYDSASRVPPEVLLPVPLGEQALLEDYLSKLRGKKAVLAVPRRGDKKQLVDMAYQNAVEMLAKRKARVDRAYERGQWAMEELADAIGLLEVPSRMECFDISHTQGVDNVASMVVFIDGQPARKEYRRFRIKTVEGADDFASMYEVVHRRLLRATQTDEDSIQRFGTLPDLMVIDGGKGQLNAAMSAMRDTGFIIPMIGLAKRLEEIYTPEGDETILLFEKSPALHALQRIRDEAHRFAVTYHRSLRASREVQSALDEVEGIGKTRKRAIMEQIKSATVDELRAIEGMNQPAAQGVYDHFHRDEGAEPTGQGEQA